MHSKLGPLGIVSSHLEHNVVGADLLVRARALAARSLLAPKQLPKQSCPLEIKFLPVKCQEGSHAVPDPTTGTFCICERGFIPIDLEGDHHQKVLCTRNCSSLNGFVQSSDGERCDCLPGHYATVSSGGSVSCAFCLDNADCPGGPFVNASVSCDYGYYNSAAFAGRAARCFTQDLRGGVTDADTADTCVECSGVAACAQCGRMGLCTLPGWAPVAGAETPWLIFRCPIEGACLGAVGGGSPNCAAGYVGVLCAGPAPPRVAKRH